ncbi:MAG: hypothetical protein VKJ02_15705 [Snowella sp.]|nr:hypothetical protein [Snowella sp.]
MRIDVLIKKAFLIQSLFFLTLVGIGLFTMPKKAQAQSACSILRPTNGNLIQKNDYSLISEPLGNFTVTCETSFEMRIDSIQSQSQNAIDQATVIIFNESGTIVEADTIKLFPPQTSISPQGPVTNQAYSVDLTLTNTSTVIPAGTYIYQVGISIVAR